VRPADLGFDAVAARARRAGKRGGVEIRDLEDALGELPAVDRALVAVVADGVIQLRAARPPLIESFRSRSALDDVDRYPLISDGPASA